MNILIELKVGAKVNRYADMISKLRVDAFKEFPYLYQGNFNYEKQYVHA